MKELMPREKALEYGISSLNNNELLALIIKSGYKDQNVFNIVESIINVANGFENLLSLSYEELLSVNGINKAKALELLAILEIAKRLTKIDKISEKSLNCPEKVVDWLRFNLAYSNQETFFAVYLNNSGKIIKSEILYKGTKNMSVVSIDEILRKAIIFKASGIIVAHNHPSNSCTPSSNDIELTNKLSNACKLIDIPLLDHLIISRNDYFSFKKNALC